MSLKVSCTRPSAGTWAWLRVFLPVQSVGGVVGVLVVRAVDRVRTSRRPGAGCGPSLLRLGCARVLLSSAVLALQPRAGRCGISSPPSGPFRSLEFALRVPDTGECTPGGCSSCAHSVRHASTPGGRRHVGKGPCRCPRSSRLLPPCRECVPWGRVRGRVGVTVRS